jgi:hypothetical protein
MIDYVGTQWAFHEFGILTADYTDEDGWAGTAKIAFQYGLLAKRLSL